MINLFKEFENLQPSTRALVYYGLVSLKNDIQRNLFAIDVSGLDQPDLIMYYTSLICSISDKMNLLEARYPHDINSLSKYHNIS